MSFSHHGQHQDNLKNSVLFQETLSDSDNIDVNKTSIEEKLENPLKPTTEVTNEDSTSRMLSIPYLRLLQSNLHESNKTFRHVYTNSALLMACLNNDHSSGAPSFYDA